MNLYQINISYLLKLLSQIVINFFFFFTMKDSAAAADDKKKPDKQQQANNRKKRGGDTDKEEKVEEAEMKLSGLTDCMPGWFQYAGRDHILNI